MNNSRLDQAKIAIAKGMVFGVGPGNSTQKDFLPYPYADFIYATIIEEYGLLVHCIHFFISRFFIPLYQNCSKSTK
ncbi:MAG: FtsW/RodA/SpoVE family cell cycle protein [Bacteroidetes bacterium]|nr:FtsW/RodA/SpoVE family cell cycle protein [Bacteroidota bacterium]